MCLKFKVKKSKNGQFFWKLVASNGRDLAVSEMYTTKDACMKTVNSIREKGVNSETPVVEEE